MARRCPPLRPSFSFFGRGAEGKRPAVSPSSVGLFRVVLTRGDEVLDTARKICNSVLTGEVQLAPTKETNMATQNSLILGVRTHRGVTIRPFFAGGWTIRQIGTNDAGQYNYDNYIDSLSQAREIISNLLKSSDYDVIDGDLVKKEI